MKVKLMTTGFAVTLLAGAALTVSMTIGASQVSAAAERRGEIHATKECSQYFGASGQFCTFTSSDLSALKVGTKIYYVQAAFILPFGLDSNVILDAGNGDRATGRCTVDFFTGVGLCTFSDGTGAFAGFRARVVVTPTSQVNYRWDGTYSFSPGND